MSFQRIHYILLSFESDSYLSFETQPNFMCMCNTYHKAAQTHEC
jgi:hypothetical protein